MKMYLELIESDCICTLSHVHARGHDEHEPELEYWLARGTEHWRAVLVHGGELDDHHKAACALGLGRHFELKEHVPPVALEAGQVRLVEPCHVLQHALVVVHVPRSRLGFGLRHRVSRRVEPLTPGRGAWRWPHHVVDADLHGAAGLLVRVVLLAYLLLGMRRAGVPDDTLLAGIVRFVGASRAYDVRRDNDERAGSVGRELFVGATELLVFVIEALLEQLVERRAYAADARVQPLEVRSDADLQWGVDAPSHSFHDQCHQLLVVVVAEEASEHVEHPVRAARPLIVHFVEEAGCFVVLPHDRERVEASDAVCVRDVLRAASPDAHELRSRQ